MKQIIFTAILIFAFCFMVVAQTVKDKEEIISQATLKTEIKGFDGKTFRLTDSKAKGVVILLWASWSPPSSLAFKDLGKINSELAKNGIEVLGLSVDETRRDKGRAKNYARKFKIKYNNGFANDSLLKSLEITGVPTIWILSKDRKVLIKIVGYSQVRTNIELKNQLNKEFSLNLKIPTEKNIKLKSSGLIISGK